MSAITTYENPGVTAFRASGASMVKNLRPVLYERGKIKIGRKGEMKTSRSGNEFQAPQKLDHFVITTLDRAQDGNFVRDEGLHREFGDKPTKIPIRLIFNDIAMNFQTRYVAFSGRTIWCQGDGETAEREGRPRACPCPNIERGFKGSASNPQCKINGRLQVMIDGASGVGGVWVFRTTSWNTVQGLISSMALISSITGGRLAGVPLVLTVSPKQVSDPDGRQQTVYIVGVEYPGPVEELRERAYQAALQDAQQGERLRVVHEAAAKMIAAPVVAPDEETDIAEEFYPDAVVDSAAEYREPAPKRDLAAELDAQVMDYDPETGEIDAPSVGEPEIIPSEGPVVEGETDWTTAVTVTDPASGKTKNASLRKAFRWALEKASDAAVDGELWAKLLTKNAAWIEMLPAADREAVQWRKVPA